MKVFRLVFLLQLVYKTAYGIPISEAESTTFDNETTIYDRSSLTPTTPEGTTTTSSPPTTTTDSHEEEDAGVSSGKKIGIAIGLGLGFVFIYFAIGLCNYICIRRASSKRKSRMKYQAEFLQEGASSSELMVDLLQEPFISERDVEDLDPQEGTSKTDYQVKFQQEGALSRERKVKMQQEPLMYENQTDVTDRDPHVSVVKYVVCWPCNLPSFKEAPKITRLLTKNVISVKSGEPLKLDIGISGLPTPTVTWRKDGNRIEGAKISNNDGVAKLEIQSAKRSDAGKYQIKVDNEIGSVTDDISVVVLEAPKIDLTTLLTNKEIRVKVGEPLKLSIGISGLPTPTVTWFKDGNRIEGARESNNDDVAKLEISKAERSDTGEYQIKLRNEIGSDTNVISVVVLEADQADCAEFEFFRNDQKDSHNLQGI